MYPTPYATQAVRFLGILSTT